MTDILTTQNRIKEALSETGINADMDACAKLAVYMDGVLEKNEHINLTAITDDERFIKEHIADSASILKVRGFDEAGTVCDVGTGAGFPGIVIAALSPEKEVTLIDSLSKRLKVIEELAGKAGISNIRLVHARAEDAGHMPELRERFDLATARAVAAMPVLAELCVPLVRTGGEFIAFKTGSSRDEIKEAQRAANILGVGSIDTQDAGVPGTDHIFAVMKKVRKTPGKYPRKAGEPARKPL